MVQQVLRSVHPVRAAAVAVQSSKEVDLAAQVAAAGIPVAMAAAAVYLVRVTAVVIAEHRTAEVAAAREALAAPTHLGVALTLG